MKKLLLSLLTVLLLVGLTACGSGSKMSSDGDTLTIYTWNEEFKGMFENYYLKDNPLPAGVEVEWIINANDGGLYQQKLDQALQNEESIDIFLLEADYAKKYVESDYTLPLTSVGISTKDLEAEQYAYTLDVVKDTKGKIKGSSWQAAPGLFFYQRSLAEKYLGTQEPAEVQAMISDWDGFLDAARKVTAGSNGETSLIASYDDLWPVVRTVRDEPWVSGGKLSIDENVEWFMNYSKVLYEEGLTAEAAPWSEAWNAGIGNDSVMGYFFPTWGVQWVMTGNSGGSAPGEGTYGDWAAVAGPQSYYWGGTWLAVAPTVDNADLVKDVIEYFTVEADSMKNYSLGSKDYVNNQAAVQEIIDGGFEFDFLGGQDHYSLFQEAAKDIDTSAMSGYDQMINFELNEAVAAYAKGEKDFDTAMKDFRDAVLNQFPEISE